MCNFSNIISDAYKPAHSALKNKIINKNISELLRNGNDIRNISFLFVSFNAGKIIPKKILNPDYWAVMHEITKTQPLVLNLSTIY